MEATTINNMPFERQKDIFNKQKQFFDSQETKPYKFRKEQLKKLKQIIENHEAEIVEALQKDFSKPPFETFVTEIGQIYEEINFALKNLSTWMRPKNAGTPLLYFPSSSRVYYQPKGVCLIIGPWNYPFNLLFAPLVAAISAGNTCMLKPPEETPHISLLIEKMIQDNFDEAYIAVIMGEGKTVVPEMIENLDLNHVFFTGSVPVGRIIAKMAAEKLTPTTLELGGKSPCIIDKSANLSVAADRITFSKFVNAGQTCVAPDYLLVHESIKSEFLDELKASIMSFYGISPIESEHLAQIVNESRYSTLKEFLSEGNTIFGGAFDDKKRKIEPTLITDVKEEDKLFQEEIFGPITPVFFYNKDEEAKEIIGKNPNPLALYIYTKNKAVEKKYINEIPFGGGCVNNGLLHLGNPEIPFGGIGNSGQGNYHGKAGFMTFSHEKSILKTGTWFDLKKKYPPYKDSMLQIIKKMMK